MATKKKNSNKYDGSIRYKQIHCNQELWARGFMAAKLKNLTISDWIMLAMENELKNSDK